MLRRYDRERAILIWLVIGITFWGLQKAIASFQSADRVDVATTVMFYMNGDNDLTDEVLSAVDQMETVGSSTKLNIVALVDGHPGGVTRFGKKWAKTHLLHITPDEQTAQINSIILANWGEQDLGDPENVTRFIRAAIELFPAERYIFCAFAHGKGVIDTGNLTGSRNGKSLSISSDATSQTIMSLTEFADALEAGLHGRRFSLMVLFSCLSSMVEIGYELSEVTDYLIASEDEIHLVNEPPGTHQLRGISFEDLLQQLKTDPMLSDIELGRSMIVRFIDHYNQEVCTLTPGGRKVFCRYPAGLALVDCQSIERLVAAIDELAAQLIEDLNQPDTVLPALASLQTALRNTPRFKSFLNLQYYDLLDWLEEMTRATKNAEIRRMCRNSANLLRSAVIEFERHTEDAKSNGISIFFNHHLVPENVSTAHLEMYRRTRFGQDTRWDEMIDTYRIKMKSHQADLLLYQCRLAYLHRDMQQFQQLSRSTFRAFSRQDQMGRWDKTQQYIQFLDTLPAGSLPPPLVQDLKKWLNHDNRSPQAKSVSDQVQRLIQRETSNEK